MAWRGGACRPDGAGLAIRETPTPRPGQAIVRVPDFRVPRQRLTMCICGALRRALDPGPLRCCRAGSPGEWRDWGAGVPDPGWELKAPLTTMDAVGKSGRRSPAFGVSSRGRGFTSEFGATGLGDVRFEVRSGFEGRGKVGGGVAGSISPSCPGMGLDSWPAGDLVKILTCHPLRVPFQLGTLVLERSWVPQ